MVTFTCTTRFTVTLAISEKSPPAASHSQVFSFSPLFPTHLQVGPNTVYSWAPRETAMPVDDGDYEESKTIWSTPRGAKDPNLKSRVGGKGHLLTKGTSCCPIERNKSI